LILDEEEGEVEAAEDVVLIRLSPIAARRLAESSQPCKQHLSMSTGLPRD
jgi:hypothetical protein